MKSIKLVRNLVAAYANIATEDVADDETIANHGITETEFIEMILFFEEHYEVELLPDAGIDMTVKELKELIKYKM